MTDWEGVWEALGALRRERYGAERMAGVIAKGERVRWPCLIRDYLIEALRDKCEHIRCVAIHALGSQSVEPTVRGAFLAALKDESGWIQERSPSFVKEVECLELQ